MKTLTAIFIFIIILLSGCKSLEEKSKAYYLGNKDKLAQLCLDCFEDKKEPIYIEGETILTTDTLIDTIFVDVECPDGTIITTECPPSKIVTKYQTRVDTIRLDQWQTLAKIELLNELTQDQYASIDRLNNDLKELEKDKNKWKKFALWSSGLIAAAALLYFVRKRLRF